MTVTTPFQRHFVVRRLRLDMINMHTHIVTYHAITNLCDVLNRMNTVIKKL